MKIGKSEKRQVCSTYNALKASFLILFACSILACNADPRSSDTFTDLVGEWRRSDFNTEFEYKLVFNSNKSGIRMERQGNENQGISSSLTFNWTANKNVLTLDFDGAIETTVFSINEAGHLHLSDITDLYFTKVK